MNDITFHRPPVAGDEIESLLGILDRTRSVFAWKCGGVDASGLRATLGPSALTLGGLLKHLALVEDHTFSVELFGRDLPPPWNAIDWDADPDWEWRTSADDAPEELFRLWRTAVERSRANVAEALGRGDMGQLVHMADSNGDRANLRRLLLDLIDEYARHNGHADLLREAVDGLVGEDPPVMSRA